MVSELKPRSRSPGFYSFIKHRRQVCIDAFVSFHDIKACYKQKKKKVCFIETLQLLKKEKRAKREEGEVRPRSKKSFKKRLKPNQTEQTTTRQVETREFSNF